MFTTDYELLLAQAQALTEDVPYPIANLANLSALLYETLEGINWAGFYLAEGDVLALGPFQGKPACVKIPWGKGVSADTSPKASYADDRFSASSARARDFINSAFLRIAARPYKASWRFLRARRSASRTAALRRRSDASSNEALPTPT